jgi:hypothetical protein
MSQWGLNPQPTPTRCCDGNKSSVQMDNFNLLKDCGDIVAFLHEFHFNVLLPMQYSDILYKSYNWLSILISTCAELFISMETCSL